MISLRLLADDLTGALDSAAAFATTDAPVPVRWKGTMPAKGSLAIDSGTREAGSAEAKAAVRRLAPLLEAGDGAIAYKKIDSLLRGNEAEEIAAVVDASRPAIAILAPAFPAQRRVTRAGQQFYRQADEDWRPAGGDLIQALRALGHPVHAAQPGEAPLAGITVFDAETDAHLDQIVASGIGLDSVLWIGSGGLAAALARRFRPADPPPQRPLPRPVLGLFGTDHAVMRHQLDGVQEWHEAIDGDDHADRLDSMLMHRGVLFLSVALPAKTSRQDAAERIDRVFSALVRRLTKPGTLIVAGGETLRRLCETLDADGLDVTGEIMPGIPRSTLVGGRWAGTTVVSKSGAFGTPELLRQLIAAEAAPLRGAET